MGLIVGNIDPVSGEGDLPVSYNQEKYLLFEEDSLTRGFMPPAFNVAFGLELNGSLDVTLLRRVINELISRHDGLRVKFVASNRVSRSERRAMLVAFARTKLFRPGLFRQVVEAATPIAVPLISIEGVAQDAQEAEIRRVLGADLTLPFNYDCPPLMRVTLLRLAAQRHLLIVVVSHLLADLWSLKLFERELSHLYAEATIGGLPPLPRRSIHFPDFASWQHRYLPTAMFDQSRCFWTDQWAAFESARVRYGEISFARSQQGLGASGVADIIELLIDDGGSGKLDTFSREATVTPYMILLAGWSILWSKYSGRKQIAVLGNFANRIRPDTAGMFGWLTNSHLIGVDLLGDPTFRQLLVRVRRTVLTAMVHQEMPTTLLWQLAGAAAPNRGPSILIDAAPKISARMGPAPSIADIVITRVALPRVPGLRTWQRGLLFRIDRKEPKTLITVHYSMDKFQQAGVLELMNNLREVIVAAVANPDLPISIL